MKKLILIITFLLFGSTAQAITWTELLNVIPETGTFTNPDISALIIDAELVTEIDNLIVDGTYYDVTFVTGTFTEAYGVGAFDSSTPGVPFFGDGTRTEIAANAVSSKLGTTHRTFGGGDAFFMPWDDGLGGGTHNTYIDYDEQLHNDFIGNYFLSVDESITFPWAVFELSEEAAVVSAMQAYIDEQVSADPVPEPTTFALLGIGLVGLAGAEVRRRRKKKAVDNS